MKILNKLFTAMLLACILLLPATSAQARGLTESQVIFGDDFTLAAGEIQDGDLAVFGGDVVIEEGAVVNGSLAVIGGDATIEADAAIEGDVALVGGDMDMDGSINGDVAIIGGQLTLGETALIDGDIATMGGELEKAPGATITGEVVDNPAPSINIPDSPDSPDVPGVPNVPNVPGAWMHMDANPFWEFGGVLVQALGVGLVGTLVALFLLPQLERVGQAITGQPLIAGSFGLLMVTVGPLALLVVGLTIILLPLSFIGVLALILAWLFGQIALGLEVGERFTRAINKTWAPALTVGFGTFLLMMVTGFIGLIPCVGWLAPFLVGLLGLGGTALTVFGTRPYPRVVAPVVVS
jgi:hypothetical protein